VILAHYLQNLHGRRDAVRDFTVVLCLSGPGRNNLSIIPVHAQGFAASGSRCAIRGKITSNGLRRVFPDYKIIIRKSAIGEVKT
jgi:hypothetical protein